MIPEAIAEAPSRVRVGDAVVGGDAPVLMAGPCTIEDEESLELAASAAVAAGARVLRGGAFKPRTSPRAFRGLGARGLEMLRAAADRHGLAAVSEALDPRHVAQVAEACELVQIGSRSMQNFALLEEVGRCGRPALLKRGAAATVEEWLGAAEYLLAAGSPGVILCERGLRGLPQPTRFTLDLGIVAWLREYTSLPILVDPSHAAGDRALVPPLVGAALAAGAHGVIVEVHPWPERALCDGPQALLPETLLRLGSETGWSRGAPRPARYPVSLR